MFMIGTALKILALGVFQFIWRVSTLQHTMNFYRNLGLTKVLLLPLNVLTLRNLAFYYMSRTSNLAFYYMSRNHILAKVFDSKKQCNFCKNMISLKRAPLKVKVLS